MLELLCDSHVDTAREVMHARAAGGQSDIAEDRA